MTTIQEREAQAQRDTLILSYLEYVNGLLHVYASSAHLDYDDLRQDATLTIMHCLDKKPEQAYTLHAYIVTSVRYRIIDKIRQAKRQETRSLDEALAIKKHEEDSTITLADLIPSTSQVEPLSILMLREQIEAHLTDAIKNQRKRKRSNRPRILDLAETVLASLSLVDCQEGALL